MSQTSPTSLRPRTFDHRCLWRMEPAQFAHAVEMIADHEALYRPELIVGVARGGVPLATLLAKRLAVDMLEVTACHNRSDAVYVQATGDVDITDLSETAQRVPPGLRVLVADDICGSGATLRSLIPALQQTLMPISIRCAALCRNASAPPGAVDVWTWETRDWVVFPWNTPPGRATKPLPEPLLHISEVAP